MATPKILVVDDQPINVQLLKRKLEREGMTVIAAYSGQEALTVTTAEKPDLILLDVMMPDMDGLEVCQRLQADIETKSIPIIFITARTSKEGKIEGLGVGAVDYITKPIDLDETLARVQTQLRFVQINRELVDLQRRLGDSRRAATIGAVTQGIAHNLNNLLGVVIGYVDLIKAYHDKPELVKKNSQHLEDAVNRIVAIIKQLTTLVVRNRPPLIRASLARMIDSGIRRYQIEYKIDQPVTVQNGAGEVLIETNVELLEEVIAKLVMNAWESYGEGAPAEQRSVTIRTEVVEKPQEGRFALIHIEDRGRGIDAEIRDHAFEPFTSTKHTVGVGMGL
ncbi:MAG: two-component system, sensor histidine kinase and response regulator, partial [Verrucomicrobiota bacterium]|nr:two-component system, sensor histidine kinase and response regulator [Verrucomicrobiota bacterium]